MNRITDKDLQYAIDRLNRATDSPMTPYTKRADGTCEANIGNFHLSHAYGGVSVHRMQSSSGGVTTPITAGHVPKRELYNCLHAFIAGFELPRNAATSEMAEVLRNFIGFAEYHELGKRNPRLQLQLLGLRRALEAGL